MEQEKLISYITGNLDESKASEVRHWIRASEEHRMEFIRLKNVYALSRSLQDNEEISTDYETLRKKLNTDRKEKLYRVAFSSLKYAAVIAITLLAVHFFTREPETVPMQELISYHQISVPLGQISEFTFADGTRVWLNSGTTLRFPERFNNARDIQLDGEAFFEVTKNAEKPFVVRSGAQQIKVFGTSFNIRSYGDLDYIETTLIEGSLGVSTTNFETMDMLNPGEQMRISDNGSSKVIRKVDTHPYEAWKEGKLIFRNKSLGDIAIDLERWYNVKISFNDTKIKDYRFSGTILKYKPIDQILEAIKLTSPIRFTIQVHPERSSEIVLYSQK
jgi:transmembrane sensor